MDAGKILLIVGVVLVVAGLLISANIRIPFLGKLPGDISIKRDNFQFYFPLATSILISLFLTLLFYLFRR